MGVSAETDVERRPRSHGVSPKLGRLLQDSSLYLIGNVIIRAVGFLAIPFYSRFLSPAQYGLIELVELSTQTVAIAFGLQAIGAALSRLFHDQQTVEDEQAVVSTSLIATGILSALVTVVAVTAARPISLLVFHDDTWVRLLQAAFIAMFFSNMIEVVLVYERIRDNAGFFLKYTLVTLFLTLGLNIVFIGVFEAGVWGFVSSKLIVTVSSSVFLLFRMRRDVGWAWRRMFVPELVRFGAPLVLSSLSYFAIHFSDRFFLSSSVSLAELGRYALAYKFAILVSALVGDSFAKSWNATLYRYVGQPKWQEQFARVGAYFTYALFATGLAIALFSPELLHVMVPPDYFPPPLLLPIIIAAYLAREIGDFFRALLLINKRAGLVGNIALGGAAANIGLNAILIPAYGIYGAAVSTFLTWFSYMIVCWVVSNAEHRLPINIAAYVRVAVLLAAIYLLGQLTRTTALSTQILLDAFWSALFCLLATRVFLSSAERWGILSFIASMASRFILPAKASSLPDRPAERKLLLIEPPRSHRSGQQTPLPRRLAEGLASAGTVTVAITDDLSNERPRSRETRLVSISSPRREQIRAGNWLVPGRLGRLLPVNARLHWLIAACKAASREADAETVLLTSGPYGLHHVAAAVIKSRVGAPWIADLESEPHERQVAHFFMGKALGNMIERMVVSTADVLVVDAGHEAQRLREQYPDRPLTIQVVAPDRAGIGASGGLSIEFAAKISCFVQVVQHLQTVRRPCPAQHA